MQIEINTPALLFPASSLLLLAYTNRMVALARLVRDLHDRFSKDAPTAERVKQQIYYLRKRIRLIRIMQFCGVISVLFCIVTMIMLFFDYQSIGEVTFSASMLFMLLSLLISAYEVTLSGKALEIELKDIELNSRFSRNTPV